MFDFFFRSPIYPEMVYVPYFFRFLKSGYIFFRTCLCTCINKTFNEKTVYSFQMYNIKQNVLAYIYNRFSSYGK